MKPEVSVALAWLALGIVVMFLGFLYGLPLIVGLGGVTIGVRIEQIWWLLGEQDPGIDEEKEIEV